MKIEYINYLYNLKTSVQFKIDTLSEICDKKQEKEDIDDGEILENETREELRIYKSQLGIIDETIEKYLQIHSKIKLKIKQL